MFPFQTLILPQDPPPQSVASPNVPPPNVLFSTWTPELLSLKKVYDPPFMKLPITLLPLLPGLDWKKIADVALEGVTI